MNGNHQTDQTTRAVPCFVALLFSLAVIAQWAAFAPSPVRRAVMFILWRAEAIAYSYIYWELHDHGLSMQWAIPCAARGSPDPDAAMLLGWWFRVLAVALRDLPRRAFFQERRGLTSPSPRQRGEGKGEEQLLGAARLANGWGRLRQRGPPLPHCIQ